MGILDDLEKMEDGESVRNLLKRIIKLEEQNQKLLEKILKAKEE